SRGGHSRDSPATRSRSATPAGERRHQCRRAARRYGENAPGRIAETNARAGPGVAARRGAKRGAREQTGRTSGARRAATESGIDVAPGIVAVGGSDAARADKPEKFRLAVHRL